MWHQYTEISTGKHKKRKSFVKPKQPGCKSVVHENSQASSYNKKSFDPRNVQKIKIDLQNVKIPLMWKDFSAL